MQVELGDRMTLRSKEEWRAAGAEFIGTLLFVYLGCGSVVATGRPANFLLGVII
jgi:aquaporin TIP